MTDQIQTPNLSQLISQVETLEELFRKDPEKLTDEDVEKIVSEMRAKRLSWAIEEQQAKSDGRRAKNSAGLKKPKPDSASKKSLLDGFTLDLTIPKT